jgi:cutinase
MQFLALLSLASAALANPIEPRQRRVGTSASEFTDGGCRDIIMIFARGSGEVGNMGTVVGPPTANGLKTRFGADRVAAEGVPYAALISTNALPGGTDGRSIQEMQGLIERAASQCPDSALVVGGYSQGAAVTHRAVENLPQATKDKIAAAFMYGDTQNRQVRMTKGSEVTRMRLITVYRTTARSTTSMPPRPTSSAIAVMLFAAVSLPSFLRILTTLAACRRC